MHIFIVVLKIHIKGSFVYLKKIELFKLEINSHHNNLLCVCISSQSSPPVPSPILKPKPKLVDAIAKTPPVNKSRSSPHCPLASTDNNSFRSYEVRRPLPERPPTPRELKQPLKSMSSTNRTTAGISTPEIPKRLNKEMNISMTNRGNNAVQNSPCVPEKLKSTEIKRSQFQTNQTSKNSRKKKK